jgi:hypothetical protein
MTESRPQDLTDGALGRRARLERAEPLTPSGREERLDLDALEKVALAADVANPLNTHARRWVSHGHGVSRASPSNEHIAMARTGAGAAHIATFDPPTVLRLIAAARHPISSEDDNAGGADTARAGEGWVTLLEDAEASLATLCARYGYEDDNTTPKDWSEWQDARRVKAEIRAALSAAPTPTQEGKEEERSQSQPCAEADQ